MPKAQLDLQTISYAGTNRIRWWGYNLSHLL